MGINILGLLKSLITLAPRVLGLFSVGSEPKITYDRGIEFALTNIFPAIRSAVEYGGLDNKEKIDAWFDAVDAGTGTDPDAIDLIKSMPDDKEEEMFDAIIVAGRAFAYNLAKVPGYWTE